MPRLRGACGLASAAMALSACATVAPPAVVTYAHADCSAGPNLSAAISLTPPKPKAAFSVMTPLDSTAPCLSWKGEAVPYRVYALPTDAEFKTLTAGSALEQARLVPPEISILDRDGKTTRSFSPPDYLFRGLDYSVQFRPRPGEAYMVVATDPARVGQTYDSIAIGTSTTTAYTGRGGFSWTSGVDQKVSRTFSFVGSIEVTVYDSRVEKPR